MYLIGDIGNSEIKMSIVNSKKRIIKKINFSSNNISLINIKKEFKTFYKYFSKIEKILFCSVVPNSFILIKKFLKTKTNVKCYEIKELNLTSLIKIKVNYNQVGSDRVTNAISLIDNKKNFIIIDLGTATTFDVLIKKETRKSFKVIITGGFSSLFKNPIKTKVVKDEDITLKGLIKILELIK